MVTQALRPPRSLVNENHKWIALFITTLGMLMAAIDGSIVLIALPAIFRGIHLDPLLPSNTFFLLWMILGFLIVTSVLVVSLGKLGDLYGRVRMYNLGFAVFTFFSLLLSITWMTGTAGGIWLIVMRIFQGVGAALLMANSAAILTDAFPPDRRGFALGINQAAAISGTFIGLLLGGLLAPVNWRLIFLVSVPIGLFATIWGYFSLHEIARGSGGKIDWAGNVTFAIGLILVMVGITYGIEPYGHHPDGVDESDRADRARPRRRLPLPVLLDRGAHRRNRCSGCSCSGSGLSRPASSPASSGRWAAAA